MSLVKRLILVFFNSTALSRLTYSLTIVAFVFIAGLSIEDKQASDLFKTLSIIQMASSLMSLGFGANIIIPLFKLTELKRSSVMLHIVIVKVCFVALISLLLAFLPFLPSLSYSLIFLILLGTVWSFVDVYVELLSKRRYRFYFILKAVVAVLILGIKIATLKANIDLLYYVLTLEGVFPLLFILFVHVNKASIKSGIKTKYFAKVYEIVLHGIFIWFSSFLQIGGSRIIYLFINSIAPSNYSTLYYLFLRLVEGLAFIPNNICASFYKKIIDQKTETSIQLQLRLQMLKTCFFASLPSFLVLFVVLFLYLNFKGLDITNYFLLLPVILSVTILSFFRIWISREIVLTENLIASPLSYILSFIFTITSLYVFSNHGMWIVVSLLVYYLSSCTAPFLINRTRMKFTRLTIKRLFNA